MAGLEYGYARVSSKDQNLDRQLDAVGISFPDIVIGDGIDDEEIGLEGLEISDGNPYD